MPPAHAGGIARPGPFARARWAISLEPRPDRGLGNLAIGFRGPRAPTPATPRATSRVGEPGHPIPGADSPNPRDSPCALGDQPRAPAGPRVGEPGHRIPGPQSPNPRDSACDQPRWGTWPSDSGAPEPQPPRQRGGVGAGTTRPHGLVAARVRCRAPHRTPVTPLAPRPARSPESVVRGACRRTRATVRKRWRGSSTAAHQHSSTAPGRARRATLSATANRCEPGRSSMVLASTSRSKRPRPHPSDPQPSRRSSDAVDRGEVEARARRGRDVPLLIALPVLLVVVPVTVVIGQLDRSTLTWQERARVQQRARRYRR